MKNILRTILFSLVGVSSIILSVSQAFAYTTTLKANQMSYEIGSYITDNAGIGKRAIYANKVADKYGRMLYGNHYYLSAGTYDIVFRMKTDAANLSQVVANIGLEGVTSGQVGAYKEIRGTDFGTNNIYKDITITVKLDYSSDDVIPYVYMNGQANLWLTTVIIKTSASSLSYTPPSGYKSLVWEAENLSRNKGSIITDATASEGKAVSATMASDSYGLITFGPYYEKVASGVHVARFRLKTDDAWNTKFIGKLEVYNSDTNSMIRTLQVTGWDFNSNNTYQNFDVPYIYTGTGKIEYRTWFYDSGALVVDKVTDMGLFTDTSAPVVSGFIFQEQSNQLNITFRVNESLISSPSITLNGEGESYPLVYISNSGDNYSYAFSGSENLANGIYTVVANSLSDMLGNTVSNVTLGSVDIQHADVTPPEINTIVVSPESASSLGTIDIYFTVNKPLREHPVVTVGDNQAYLISTPDQDISHRYHFGYTVVDSSDIPTTVTKNISIRATDLSGNTGLNSSTQIDLNLTNIGIMYESENLPASAGQVIPDTIASSGKARKATVGTDAKGLYLQFGPYSTSEIPKTAYVAKFRMKVSDNSSTETLAIIDALSNDGITKRSIRQVRGVDFSAVDSYQDIELPFVSGENGAMEYRVQFSAVADVTVDRVSILPATVGETISYESEDMYGAIGNLITDALASASKSVYAKVGKDNPGTLQFGPYNTMLVKGTPYTASFKVKTNANTSAQPIALVDVYDEQTGYREYKELRAVDFSSVGSYETFEVPFVMPSSSNVEFRVFFYGAQDIWADKVEITKQTIMTLPEYESENLPIIKGRVVIDTLASGNMSVEAKVGRETEGTIQFGPYDATNLVNGKLYKAVFRLKTKDNTNANYIGLVDVYAGSTGFRKTLEIKGTDFSANDQFQDFSINFSKPIDVNDLEYRVVFYAKSDLLVDKVKLIDGVTEGLPVYESEKLPNPVGKIVSDVSASSGKAVFFDRSIFPSGWIQFGPYKMEGVQLGQSYHAAFRLKVTDNTVSDPVAIINVYNANKGMDERIILRGTDFAVANQYQEFTMPFTVFDREYMEFKVYATGGANIYADKVTINQ